MSDYKFDTVIVSAQEWGITYVLKEKNCWYISRLSKDSIKNLKYIAFYQTAPICAITCYAKIKKIEFDMNQNHYVVLLQGKPIEITKINLDKNKRHLAPQSIKYVLFKNMLKAKKISDL